MTERKYSLGPHACNMHLNEVADSAKQGGLGSRRGAPQPSRGAPGETQVKPTAMLWRNMAAMAMEEMFRANPIDGLVLLGGCGKTIRALLMAAASVDIPAVIVPGGPMLTGHFRGQALECGTDVWHLSEEARAGTITTKQFLKSEQSMIRSKGHCNTLGTASIMAVAAVGGSTNSVVHLLAIAERLGIDLTLEDFDAAGAGVPVMANLQPSGAFLMDDLYRAGGVPALLSQASIAVLSGTPARAEVLLGRVQAPNVESLSVHRQKH